MRAQKRQDDQASVVSMLLQDQGGEWRRLCEQATGVAGADDACFVFFSSTTPGLPHVPGGGFHGWAPPHYAAAGRQPGDEWLRPCRELHLDSDAFYAVVPAERGDTRGLLLLLYGEAKVPCEQGELLALLAGHGALLWREQEQAQVRARPELSTERLLSRLKPLFMNAPILVNGFDRHGRCILWNNECERVFGWSFEELQAEASPISVFYPDPEDRRQVIATFEAPTGCEFREWHPVDRAGRRLTTLWANIVLPNGDMICVGHDITEQRKLENQQRLAASVFDSCYDGIVLTDADNRVLHVNPAFTRITGYSADEALDKPAALFGLDSHEIPLPAQEGSPRHWQGECFIQRKNGSECALLLAISVIRDKADKVQYHALVLTDITLLKEHEAELRQRALYDPLTRIPNRQLFSELLDKAMAAADRSQTMLAVCYLDLDGFKQVNDTLGHAAGDQLLMEMGRRMELVLRNCDTVARLGGDEFALMITGLHHELECTEILDRVLAAIDVPVRLDGHQARVSASIGVSVYDKDASDGQTLLRYADKAMYEAKKQGKRRHLFFEPVLHLQEQERYRLYQELRQALINDEFLLHYQPKIDLFSRHMIGLEALLRWQHPQKGLLTPVEFMPAVLDSDMEFELGQWVIRRLLQQMTAWSQAGHDYCASFNVSAGQLMHEEFFSNLTYLLSLYASVAPERLELEFQESAVLEDVHKAAAVLEQCRDLGLVISLDNFGSGHGSLVHLNRLPVDIIKIDRRFINELLAGSDEASMVEGVVQLASALRMLVLAEGMEQPELSDRLQQLGCHYVQGYGISHPLPAEEVHQWLAEWNQRLRLQ
ncbi:PAS domain S-box protein [Oceanimonas doudoroffii]|uniref:PAS domain S-box protein n=2 Tax=Oceanimonas doudoroffii TaxID=84158 RepID=A0A233RD46_9GAMM|nr:PAS domain S-box protein [Oceanimonas doudoroffii]